MPFVPIRVLLQTSFNRADFWLGCGLPRFHVNVLFFYPVSISGGRDSPLYRASPLHINSPLDHQNCAQNCENLRNVTVINMKGTAGKSFEVRNWTVKVESEITLQERKG